VDVRAEARAERSYRDAERTIEEWNRFIEALERARRTASDKRRNGVGRNETGHKSDPLTKVAP